jgi:sensor histidine kinase YesM
MHSPRRIYLLNKGFQLRFAFYVCSWLIALSLAYPLIISNLFDYLIQYLALDPLGPALATLEKTREDLLWLLILMQAVMLTITFLISIFMSHKIAGPLYKLRRYFQEVRAGKLDQKLSFRKNDYFQELVPDYNSMMETIRHRIDVRSQGIESAISHIEKALDSSGPENKRELEAALHVLNEARKN